MGERLVSRVLAAERSQAELSSRVELLERERLTADTSGQSARGNSWGSRILAEQLDNINIQFSHMRGDMTEMQEHLHRGSSTPPVVRVPAPEAAIVTAVNDARLLCTQLCELVSCLEQRCAALEETFQLAGGVPRPLSGSASAWSTSTTNKLKEELSHRTQARFKEHLVESLARVGMSVNRLTPRQQQQQQQEPSPHPPETQSTNSRAMNPTPRSMSATPRSMPSCTTTP